MPVRTTRNLFRRIGSSLSLSQDWHMLLLAGVCGVFMAGVALAFIGSIDWLHHHIAQFARRGSAELWIGVGLPVVGALVTVFVFWLFPSTFKGHGVSRVILAVAKQKSVLPLQLAPRQLLGATATIASGGSAGPEGPIVAVGAAIGSFFSSWLELDTSRRTTLLGCGAAAGLAAVFNAPIAGVFFVLEVILRDFTPRTFTPIVIASVTAAATAQTILHSSEPIFGISAATFDQSPLSLVQTPQYALLGLIVGFAAAGFSVGMKSAHRLFDRLPARVMTRPIIGAAALVVLGAVWVTFEGDGERELPPFYGMGYSLVRELLQLTVAPGSSAFLLLGSLAVIVVLKVLATGCTLGSGGAGGLFAPGLVLGALLGALFSALTKASPLLPDVEPVHGVLVGMGAFVAASSHAPLAGAFLVYELSHSYAILLPLLLAAVIATVAARFVYSPSIYTAELAAFNIRIASVSAASVLRGTFIRDTPLLPAIAVGRNDSAESLITLGETHGVHDFPVVDAHGVYTGLVCGSDLRSALIYRDALRLLSVAELERTDFLPLDPHDTLETALHRFGRHETQVLPVVDPISGAPVGLISRSQLMALYNRATEDA